jgi:chromosome segregation ATPase
MMSRETLVRLARRTIVLGATVAVIGAAVGTVQLAAQWRADAAPLDTALISMSTIEDQAAIEQGRSDDITNQMGGVAAQVSELQAALITANGGVNGQAKSAAALQAQLKAAKAKLTTLQKQLKAAQQRLQALNAAAARQAAINRAAAHRSSGGSSATATPRPPEHEGGDDD